MTLTDETQYTLREATYTAGISLLASVVLTVLVEVVYHSGWFSIGLICAISATGTFLAGLTAGQAMFRRTLDSTLASHQAALWLIGVALFSFFLGWQLANELHTLVIAILVPCLALGSGLILQRHGLEL